MLSRSSSSGVLLEHDAPAPPVGPAPATHLEFWRGYLADCPLPRLSPSLVRSGWKQPFAGMRFHLGAEALRRVQRGFGARWTRAIEAALVSAFRQACGVQGCTLGRVRSNRDASAHASALVTRAQWDPLVLAGSSSDPLAVLLEIERETTHIGPYRDVAPIEKLARWPAMTGANRITPAVARVFEWMLSGDRSHPDHALSSDAHTVLAGALLMPFRSTSDAHLSVNIHLYNVAVTANERSSFQLRSFGDERLHRHSGQVVEFNVFFGADGGLEISVSSKLRPAVVDELGAKFHRSIERLTLAQRKTETPSHATA